MRDEAERAGRDDDVVALSAAGLVTVSARGVPVPMYDRDRLRPRIVHIGVGGFHRSHLAVYTDDLAAAGSEWGIRGLGVLPGDEAMAAALNAQDGLYTLIERGNDEPRVRVVGSLLGMTAAAADPARAIATMADPAVSIVSLTITEAGYRPGSGPTFGLIAAALDRRRREGSAPVTILSCDNLPGNGDAARVATATAAAAVGGGLAPWVDANCTFPNSMVDRITPVTTDDDRHWLRTSHGIADRWPVVAEPFRQWVVEDRFVDGRPPWEDAGAPFSDDVRSWELYKLRMLNAAHSTMAYLCALAGITFVDEAIAQPAVRAFLERFLADEAIPSLSPIDGHPREDYAATVLVRFGNTGVRDQIARLCIDGTAKFPTFLVPTIEHHLAVGGPIARGTLALAGWARYLGTVDAEHQAVDASAHEARRHATAARTDPVQFLRFDQVFPAAVRDDRRFQDEFAAFYRAVADRGPLEAMAAAGR